MAPMGSEPRVVRVRVSVARSAANCVGSGRGIAVRQDPVYGDAVSSAPAACECWRGKDEARRAVCGSDGDDGSSGFDESSEHRYRVTRSGGGDVGPGVVEVAGDANVFRVGDEIGGKASACDLGEALLQSVRRIEAGGEGKGVEAELAFGVVEDELIDEGRCGGDRR